MRGYRPLAYLSRAWLSAFGLLEPCADPRLAPGAAVAALYQRLYESFYTTAGINHTSTFPNSNWRTLENLTLNVLYLLEEPSLIEKRS